MLDGLFYYYMMGVYLVEEGCEDEEPENNNKINEDEAEPENIDERGGGVESWEDRELDYENVLRIKGNIMRKWLELRIKE